MYAAIRNALFDVLRVPAEAPDPPAGSHASVAVFRASPRFLTYRLALLAAVAAFGGLVLGVLVLPVLFTAAHAGEAALGLAGLALAALVLAAALGVVYFAIRVDYDLRYYIVTDRSLRVRQGAWTVEELTLTYANVQNLRIVQGPVQRLFGISDLRVDTAGGGHASKGETGGGGHHAKLAGIENAREVRDRILAYVRGARAGTGLGDPDDARPDGLGAGREPPGSAAFQDELERVRVAAAGLRSAAAARRSRS